VTDEPTDAELLLASQEDAEAFAAFYRRHAEDILRYFARRTLDPEVAAELTAESFAEAFASRRSYRDEGVDGVAWLYGIARHQLGRFFRAGRVHAAARRKLGMPERELPSEDYERIEELVDFEPLREALIDALDALPVHQRTAVRLRIVEGKGYEDVASELGCTADNARQRVSRGLRRLGVALQASGMQVVSE
jgi:RNA polymerase sigma factor (sigma-70 family)